MDLELVAAAVAHVVKPAQLGHRPWGSHPELLKWCILQHARMKSTDHSFEVEYRFYRIIHADQDDGYRQ